MGALFDLSGKVAVVTGSTRGIGRAIAERLGEHGAKVVISSRTAAECEQVAAELAARGIETLSHSCDVASKEGLQQLVSATLGRWGAIDILVCNAAVNPYFGPMSAASDADYERIMNTNVRSNFWLCNLVAPHMAERGGGSLILISSIAGLVGSRELGVYGISKAADLALMRNLAVEWGRKNVRANCIVPGLVRTEFARALWENPKIYERVTKSYPLGRIGEPDEIAGAAVFLAAPSGSFITGQAIIIDGGGLVNGA